MNARLTEIVADHEKVSTLCKDEVCSLIGEIAVLDARLRFRLAELGSRSPNHPPSEGDRLLTVKEVAQMLSCSTDRLYRHPPELRSLEVRSDGGALRYSLHRVQNFIRNRAGR